MSKHRRPLGLRRRDAIWLRQLDEQQHYRAELAERRRKELERRERQEAWAAEHNRAI